jgi:hypothetical protein
MNLTKLKTLSLSGAHVGAPLAPIWTLPALSGLDLHDAVLTGIPGGSHVEVCCALS